MRKGYFGEFGGIFIPETLVKPLKELDEAFQRLKSSEKFNAKLNDLLKNFAGRPTPITFCENLSKKIGCKIYLKREDLLHTGAHKLNNTLGQALIAKELGKKRIIAETGAGQHGFASAVAAAKLGLECDVFMGTIDMERQQPNVQRMKLCGAKVIPVNSGSKTLKDAINECLRDYTASFESTHYLLGSALGPHPYPSIVSHFQSIIGREAKKQILELEGKLPNKIIACVGGGSNAIGIFKEFLEDKVELIGVEAGGKGISSGKHAARFSDSRFGRKGIIHGAKTFVLQDEWGQIMNTHSISAGLDYSAVGPEHSMLHEKHRVKYSFATDEEATNAFKILSEQEGIIPALESAHAIAEALKLEGKVKKEEIILINLSGRGDKDLEYMHREGTFK